MIKTFTILSTLVLMLFFTNLVQAQQLFTDDFESGTASPDWERYFEAEDLISAVPMATAPDPLATGGNYIGWLQDSDGSYTGAALSVAGTTDLQNYSIEADVYCYIPDTTEVSEYTGIAFYADSTIDTYIKMVCDFDASQRIRLYNNHFDLITFQYTFEHNFTAADIPGGIPTEEGWHKMKVEIRTLNADTTAFWCYFDGNLLAGCPIYDTSDDRMSSGQFGLFSFKQDSNGVAGYFDNVVVNSLVSSVEDNSEISLPDGFSLEQNYPNPFNPETKISYKLTNSAYISLNVYDLLGREIKTLVSKDQTAGSYTVSWDGKDESGNIVPSGIYLYTLKAGSFTESKKMILMK